MTKAKTTEYTTPTPDQLRDAFNAGTPRFGLVGRGKAVHRQNGWNGRTMYCGKLADRITLTRPEGEDCKACLRAIERQEKEYDPTANWASAEELRRASIESEERIRADIDGATSAAVDTSKPRLFIQPLDSAFEHVVYGWDHTGPVCGAQVFKCPTRERVMSRFACPDCARVEKAAGAVDVRPKAEPDVTPATTPMRAEVELLKGGDVYKEGGNRVTVVANHGFETARDSLGAPMLVVNLDVTVDDDPTVRRITRAKGAKVRAVQAGAETREARKRNASAPTMSPSAVWTRAHSTLRSVLGDLDYRCEQDERTNVMTVTVARWDVRRTASALSGKGLASYVRVEAGATPRDAVADTEGTSPVDVNDVESVEPTDQAARMRDLVAHVARRSGRTDRTPRKPRARLATERTREAFTAEITPTRVMPAGAGLGATLDDSENETVRAILADLDKAGVELATVSGDDWADDESTHGAIASPRPEMDAVYVYWVTAGSIRDADGRIPGQVRQMRRTLREAGWDVSTDTRGSSVAVVRVPGLGKTTAAVDDVAAELDAYPTWKGSAVDWNAMGKAMKATNERLAQARAEDERQRAERVERLVWDSGVISAYDVVKVHPYDIIDGRVVVTLIGDASAFAALSRGRALRTHLEELGHRAEIVPANEGARLTETEERSNPVAVRVRLVDTDN